VTILHRQWWPRRCTRCGRRAPRTYHGWCPPCVRDCCGAGEGPRVGLPVPADLEHAVRQLDDHLRHDKYRPRACWTCALLTADCPECETSLFEMTPEHRAQHRIVGQWIAIGCELYATPAVRAAAAPLAR
jgi:hypothetical protein